MCKNNKIKIIFAVLLVIAVQGIAYADDACEKLVPTSLRNALEKKYPDYNIAKSTDQKTNDPEWNKYYYKEGQCLTVASGDFDGDKNTDYVLFIVKKNTTMPKLVVALSRNKHWSINELPIWNEQIEGCYVETTKPGTYEHTMSYEFKPSKTNEREKVTTNNTSIIAGRVESTGVVYVYDKGQWLYVWVSD